MKHFASLVVLVAMSLAAVPSRADEWKVDPVHSSVIFRIQHGGAGYTYGRFNDPSGTFTLDDADPTKSAFNIELKVEGIDTHNAQRDGHLKSPDFFNAKQFPTITFKSTAVKKGDGNILQVTGDLTVHGVTKSVTVPVELTGKGELPPGVKRAGAEATFTIKRSDYDMGKMVGPVGDEVRLIVALEGTK